MQPKTSKSLVVIKWRSSFWNASSFLGLCRSLVCLRALSTALMDATALLPALIPVQRLPCQRRHPRRRCQRCHPRRRRQSRRRVLRRHRRRRRPALRRHRQRRSLAVRRHHRRLRGLRLLFWRRRRLHGHPGLNERRDSAFKIRGPSDPTESVPRVFCTRRASWAFPVVLAFVLLLGLGLLHGVVVDALCTW